MGYFFEPSYCDGYCISLSAYDAYLEYEKDDIDSGIYTGHTYKNYYFYYDNQSGDFKEYVGKTISESDLLDSCGFDLASEIRSAGYEVDEIFKRDNGIINVNYSQTTLEEDNTVWVEYHNATYNEETGQFVDVFESGNLTWQDSDFQGTYVNAITQ